MDEDVVESGTATESELVEMWRLSECLRLGLEDDLAQEFAESKADLSRFRDLVEKHGWSPEAAFRAIL